MSEERALLRLHDVDLMLEETRAERRGARVPGLDGRHAASLERTRGRLAGALDRRWLGIYERARQRYGRGLAAVRGRVCQGCHVTLPTSVQRPEGDVPLSQCESCGRILYWP